MSRPEHPGVPLPASCIRELRARQEIYDKDIEAYRRREIERQEEILREEYERNSHFNDFHNQEFN